MGFCYKTAAIWQLIGYAFLVLKIVIPIILIVLGIINLAQAVISSDEKQISKTTISLIKRIIVGMVIFFIPLIVSAMFNLLGLFIDYKDDFKNCLGCITAPRKKCDTTYSGSIIPLVGGGNFDVPDEEEEEKTPVEPVSEGTIIFGTKVGIVGDGLEYKEDDHKLTITKGGNYRFRGNIKNVQVDIDTAEEVNIVLRGVYMASENATLITNKQANKLVLTLEENSNNTLRASSDNIITTNGDVVIKDKGNLTFNNELGKAIDTPQNVIFEGGNIVFNIKDTEGQQKYLINGGQIVAWSENFANLKPETTQNTMVLQLPNDLVIGETLFLVDNNNENIITFEVKDLNKKLLLLSSPLLKQGIAYHLMKITEADEESVNVNVLDNLVLNNTLNYYS